MAIECRRYGKNKLRSGTHKKLYLFFRRVDCPLRNVRSVCSPSSAHSLVPPPTHTLKCYLTPDPVFHFPVLLESWTTPWLESVLKIVHSLGGSSHLCCCSQCRSSSSLLPSVCAQRTQLKPDWGRGRAAWGQDTGGPGDRPRAHWVLAGLVPVS